MMSATARGKAGPCADEGSWPTPGGQVPRELHASGCAASGRACYGSVEGMQLTCVAGKYVGEVWLAFGLDAHQ